MPSGTLGQASLAADTNTTVYTVPASKVGSVSVTISNTNPFTPAVIRLAVAAASTPSAAEYLEFDTVLPAGSEFEKTGVVLSANKNLVAYSTTGNVSVNVYGFEE
jgi:hypothetical protein